MSILTERAPTVSASTSKPRLLFVCPGVGDSTTHWIERQIAWIDRLHTSVLCWRSNLDQASCSAPVHVVPFDLMPNNGRGRWWHRIRALPSANFYASVGAERDHLRAVIEELRPDVILGHFGYMALRVLPLASERGIPVVAYFHGLDISSMLRIRWYRWSLIRQLKNFAATIAVGSHQVDWLISHGFPPEHAHAIPSGTRTELFKPREHKAERPIRLIAVSRLIEPKGVDISLRAFALASARHPDMELHIVGEGPEESALRALAAEFGVAKRTHFRGRLSSEQVATLMGECHIFVQHSLKGKSGWVEGFGNSITEASSCELPAVVSDSTGIRDQVTHEETGLVSPQGDVDAMAGAIERLADDPELRARLGRAGRSRAVENFDARRSLERLEDVLLDAATVTIND